MLESYLQTAWRHTRSFQFDPATLIRGIRQLREQIKTINLNEGIIAPHKITRNFAGVRGVTVSSYSVLIPPHLIGGITWKKSTATFTDFSPNLNLNIHVVSKSNTNAYTGNYISQIPEAVASFTGPTIIGDIPNNGFFHRDAPDTAISFQDTNPSGQRRGAIGITNDGKTRLLKDDEKWAIVRNNFAAYRTLSGTSFYITDQDTEDLPELKNDHGRGRVSYLIQYRNRQNASQLCFLVPQSTFDRLTVKKIIDQYIKNVGGKGYMAVELEMNSANSVVKSPGGKIIRVTDGGYDRRDHYVMERHGEGLFMKKLL